MIHKSSAPWNEPNLQQPFDMHKNIYNAYIDIKDSNIYNAYIDIKEYIFIFIFTQCFIFNT